MFAVNRNHNWLARVLLLVLLLSAFPTGAKAISFNEIIATAKDLFPILNILPQFAPIRDDGDTYAQTASFGGGEEPMVIYFKEIDGAGVGNTSCPAGWSEALYGYGPHYLGLVNYDWKYETTGGGGFNGGGGQPTPPTIPIGPPAIPGGGHAPPGGPGGAGGGGGGGGGGGPGGPGGGGAPNGPSGPTTPPGGGGEPPPPPGGGSGSQTYDLFQWISTAYAQEATNYYIKDVAIGSDSVCSQSKYAVAPFETIYKNALYGKTVRLYSEACFVNASSSEECNRCRVCYK